MIRNKEIYNQALIFRQQGFSYSEISKLLKVPKSTLSTWFAKKRFSKEVTKNNTKRAARDNKQRIALLNKSRNKEREKAYKAARKQAETEYRHYRHNPLFVSGVMLYVGVGDVGSKSSIRLSGSNLDLHVIFHKFVKEYLGVTKDQLHFWLLLYPTANESKCVSLWSKKLKINPAQFYKNQFINNFGKKQSLHYGVGNTIIGSTVLKIKLVRWCELLSKELQKQ